MPNINEQKSKSAATTRWGLVQPHGGYYDQVLNGFSSQQRSKDSISNQQRSKEVRSRVAMARHKLEPMDLKIMCWVSLGVCVRVCVRGRVCVCMMSR